MTENWVGPVLPVRPRGRVLIRLRAPARRVRINRLAGGLRRYAAAAPRGRSGKAFAFRVPRGERRRRELDLIVTFRARYNCCRSYQAFINFRIDPRL